MYRVPLFEMKVWCAKWYPRRGRPPVPDTSDPQWCATQRQANPPKARENNIATVCSHFITLTGGVEKREPTCNDCCRLLGMDTAKPKKSPRPL